MINNSNDDSKNNSKKKGISFLTRLLISVGVYLVLGVGGSYMISYVTPDDPSFVSLIIWFCSIALFILILDPSGASVFGQGIFIDKKNIESIKNVDKITNNINETIQKLGKENSSSLTNIGIGILVISIMIYFIFIIVIPTINGAIYGNVEKGASDDTVGE